MGKGKNSGKKTARMPAGKFGKLQKKMESRKGVGKPPREAKNRGIPNGS